jgi:NADPH:quinone reductase-like Zn-dependent oxidoreductase
VRSIGADRVIDYTKEGFTKSPQHYDVILDSVGNHSFLAYRRVLSPKGIYVVVGGPSGRWMISPLVRFITGLGDVTVHEPKAGIDSGETEQRRPDHHARPHEEWKGNTCH